MRPIHPDIQKFANPLERDTLEALETSGWDIAAAAASLGIKGKALHCRLDRLRRRAATRGSAPEFNMTQETPEGFHVKGVSSYFGPEGELKGQWVKTSADKLAQLELFRRAAEEMTADLRGRYDPLPGPGGLADLNDDILAVYPLGDHHLGMLAWGEETGEDYDVEIASDMLGAAVDFLATVTPPTREALLIVLGDFYHSDSRNNRTEMSGNALDVDGRFAKIARLGVELLRRTIDRMLERHEVVHVQVVGGNHDYHSAVWTRIALDAAYSREPRINIDMSPADRLYFRWGKCFIGATHGHAAKPKDLSSIMSNERASDWGETEHREWFTGHVHHETFQSYPGCVVHTQEILPSGDAWHVGAGYAARRSMCVELRHKEHGEIGRHRAPIGLVKARMK